MALRTLGLIPARKGSQRIRGKNLQVVNGLTLIERAILAALFASRIDGIIVSSDDWDVLDIAAACGIPYCLRPDKYARDDSPMIDVVRHALTLCDGYDAVCILEPPATFRLAAHIDAAVELLEGHHYADGVRTVSRINPQYPFMHRISPNGYLDPLYPEAYALRSPVVYQDNGVANVMRIAATGNGLFTSRIMPLEVANERGLDIDWPDQLEHARIVAGDLDRV